MIVAIGWQQPALQGFWESTRAPLITPGRSVANLRCRDLAGFGSHYKRALCIYRGPVFPTETCVHSVDGGDPPLATTIDATNASIVATQSQGVSRRKRVKNFPSGKTSQRTLSRHLRLNRLCLCPETSRAFPSLRWTRHRPMRSGGAKRGPVC